MRDQDLLGQPKQGATCLLFFYLLQNKISHLYKKKYIYTNANNLHLYNGFDNVLGKFIKPKPTKIMCNPLFNPRLSPVNHQNVSELQELYPEQSQFIGEIYKAMTNGLAPQVNLLVMFTLLRHLYQKNVEGILHRYNLLYVPLSIVAKTAENTWTRFRPKSVKELHTAFLSFMMAETNRVAVNNVCGKYGLAMGQAHCCGVLFGSPADISRYQKSELYAKRNFLRSAIESLGMPVEEVSFEEIPEVNIDLGLAELEFFDLYDQVLSDLSLPGCVHKIPEEFMLSIDYTWESVLSVTPVAKPEYA